MLSAFAKGYMWLPVLAGFLGHKYGSKYFLISAIVINSIAFILIPFAASNSGSTGVTICRYIQGAEILNYLLQVLTGNVSYLQVFLRVFCFLVSTCFWENGLHQTKDLL